MTLAIVGASDRHDRDRLLEQLGVIETLLGEGNLPGALRCLRAVRGSMAGRAVPARTGPGRAAPAHLTGRELAVLRLLQDGSLSRKDMARRLGVTRNTVKTHLKSVYLKLGAHSRGEAIERGRRLGLIAVPVGDAVALRGAIGVTRPEKAHWPAPIRAAS